ncbi:DUF2917 domain-containing protein [Ramlibacter albus]|uniref:DUF2917 domain-containing protein n=1 Tax=Ramlibacter albus TaxID=2079448 RepID=A0A923M5I8_9BURK|nr:DUF2917 domain-containing protein [Ramlibacter albus]MBC5764268.1 DUF2917 domain-containing protein [Ramlibacter albus]
MQRGTPMNRQLLNFGPRGLHALTESVDTLITCTRGSVWVTLDDDVRDYVLETGDTFRAPAGRRTVVYAFEVSVVALQPADPRAVRTPSVGAVRTTAQVAV